MARVGRPKGDNNKDYNYTIRLDDATRNRLEAYCVKMQIQKAEAIRQAIMLLSDSENTRRPMNDGD